MSVLIQFDFPYPRPFGKKNDFGTAGFGAVHSHRTGLPLENLDQELRAGGVYLFQDRAAAEAYIASTRCDSNNSE